MPLSTLPPSARVTASRIWSLCNVLRGDGISYNQYIAELTYLLFLKVAEENGAESLLPDGYRWRDLVEYDGPNLLGHYQEMLTHLGTSSETQMVRDIFAFPTTVFSHSENLRVVVTGLNEIRWNQLSQDSLGHIYEALLAKNSEDARSGAGQYFTPRALVDCIVSLIKPKLGEIIQDPSTGTGGFLISADEYTRSTNQEVAYVANPPKFEGVEIERGTYRLCLMNVFLHRMNASIVLGDALTDDGGHLQPADVIIANPPFGAKSGSVRATRGSFSYSSSNKQLEFLQHIYQGLKPGGRAAVVLPDNVLFEEGVARQIRRELMDLCSLHTILRLPTGIFYAQGVKTNVLFFTRGTKEIGNTNELWIYDLRTAAPKFGKKNPLTAAYFADFVSSFGDWPGSSESSDDRAESERFRRFDRDHISKLNDNLDIHWLAETAEEDEFEGLRPEEISALILGSLGTLLKDAEDLHATLNMSEDDQ
jgi:type I restriction enzyme M protein